MNKQGVVRGFTIVELLIVIVIIGILASIGVVAYGAINKSARDNSVLSDIDAVASEVTRYSAKNGGVLGSAVAWYSGGSPNANINFIPSSGNVIDLVTSDTAYCIRGYNPGANKNSISNSYAKGSSDDACIALSASVTAGGAGTAIIGWWKLNGGTNDSSGNGNNGIFDSPSYAPTLTTGQNGASNNAYLFDGVNDYINIPQQKPIDLTQPFTVSLWAKGAPNGNYEYIFHRGSTSGIGPSTIFLGALNTGNYSLSVNGNFSPGDTTILTSSSTWRLLTLTYDGSVQKSYVDGVLMATYTAGAITNVASPNSTSIGSTSFNPTTRPFAGSIDDVRIYKGALSVSDILALYSAGAN